MMGGRNMPPMDAAGSIAPATWGRKPARFIKGMVKAPVETVLAMALPETDPNKAEAITATLAGPPVVCPAAASGRSMKKRPAPDLCKNAPKKMNKMT
jgi:hypothetical protein